MAFDENALFLNIISFQSQLMIRMIRKSGFLFSPKSIRVCFPAIAQQVIPPEKNRVQGRNMFNTRRRDIQNMIPSRLGFGYIGIL